MPQDNMNVNHIFLASYFSLKGVLVAGPIKENDMFVGLRHVTGLTVLPCTYLELQLFALSSAEDENTYATLLLSRDGRPGPPCPAP